MIWVNSPDFGANTDIIVSNPRRPVAPGHTELRMVIADLGQFGFLATGYIHPACGQVNDQ